MSSGEDDADGGGVNQPLGFELKSIDSSHPYLRKRGIKPETAKHFGIGYFHGRGSMEDRLVIPIHNEVGELVAYAGRAVDDEVEPKYKVPAGFRKSLVLFNYHRAKPSADRGVVIVVEGFFDCMKVHQAGFPNVVALMGSELYDRQEELLVESSDRVVLMLDADEAGQSATPDIALRLMRKVLVRVVELPNGAQPDRLSSVEIRRILGGIVKPIDGGSS